MKNATYSLLFGTVLMLAACSPGESADPYADPGTPPPPAITDPTVTPAMRLSEPDANRIVTINVAGMAGVSPTSLATADLRNAFTVVEDGVVKGITVEEIGGGTRAGADIAFVFDTTGSMSGQIEGARDSIIAFADFLDSSGLDVRLGAVTYGDAFDTVAEGSDSSGVSIAGDTPPTFDAFERPTFGLTTDIGAFQGFIEEQDAKGGRIFPENGLGALHFARQSLDWRPTAQCILIVVTDASAWSHENPGDNIPEDSRWHPPVLAEVIADLRGECVVHVVGPDPVFVADNSFDMADLTGADATGGVFTRLSSGLDLSELPIGDVLASGYVVRYRGTVDGSEHSVRLVVDDGELRGETTTNVTY